MRKVVKALFPGVAWKNPIINAVFRGIDPFDRFASRISGHHNLPPYHIRVRSNGVTKQFGGHKFSQYGELLRDLLVQHAGIDPESSILEIGCGCGRTALALKNYLKGGSYTGMDIERESIRYCQNASVFQCDAFTFDFLDVQNDEYNPAGEAAASDYVFPYEDGEFHAVFLVSVFTHMLTDDVKNYIEEIARMLKPGGTLMLTTFLMDHGKQSSRLFFPLSDKEHHFNNREMPEVAVGYYRQFFVDECEAHGLFLKQSLLGGWRGSDSSVSPESGFSQDMLFFAKPAR